MIEVVIRISGRGRVGADGMGLWYTTAGAPTSTEVATVFGARDQWNGLGIILDSFDNDAKQDNPKIMVFRNDGTQNFKHNEVGNNYG